MDYSTSCWCTVFLWISTILLLNIEASDKFSRQLSLPFQCNSSADENTTLIMGVKAVGPHDELFHIWDARGPFTIMMLRFPRNTSMDEVNCTELLSSDFTRALKFDQPVDYSFAVVLTELFQYDDVSDTAQFVANESLSFMMPFGLFNWTTKLTQNEDSISMKYSLLDNENSTLGTGALQLELSLRSDTERPDRLPRLVQTANSTVVDFVVEKAIVKYNHSRFAVRFHLFNGNNTKPFEKYEEKLIDDEYTPGVFKVIQVKTPKDLSGYLEWKPTVYTSDDHKHDSSTETKESDVFDYAGDASAFNKSIAFAIYGEDMYEMNQTMTVSFGMSGDLFYASTNYSSWTFAVGCGDIPEDSISSVIIIIIAVGLGIPVLLLLAGAVFILVKRYRYHHDDLLLSH